MGTMSCVMDRGFLIGLWSFCLQASNAIRFLHWDSSPNFPSQSPPSADGGVWGTDLCYPQSNKGGET